MEHSPGGSPSVSKYRTTLQPPWAGLPAPVWARAGSWWCTEARTRHTGFRAIEASHLQGREHHWLSLGSLMPTYWVLCASSAESEMQSKEKTSNRPHISYFQDQMTRVSRSEGPLPGLSSELDKNNPKQDTFTRIWGSNSPAKTVLLVHWPPLGEAGKKAPSQPFLLLGGSRTWMNSWLEIQWGAVSNWVAQWSSCSPELPSRCRGQRAVSRPPWAGSFGSLHWALAWPTVEEPHTTMSQRVPCCPQVPGLHWPGNLVLPLCLPRHSIQPSKSHCGASLVLFPGPWERMSLR